MSALLFTPGPWLVHTEAEYNIGRTSSVYICRSNVPWPNGQLARVNVADELGSQIANARLIAKAPELYWALLKLARAAHACAPQCEEVPGEVQARVNEAFECLARARGESIHTRELNHEGGGQ